MLDLYLPLVGIALAIALAVARLVIGFLPHLRLVGYVLSGFVGLIALHVILEAVLGLSGIAPTRFSGACYCRAWPAPSAVFSSTSPRESGLIRFI
ncbi:MAG: hypothetical protein U5O39_05285 [Gammaproteobacteria bacterium]|nr:hypothetical protein [Gammaproteobacteria bacterium]